ncbi:PrgI family protein [Catenulispora pinisilvae]|uniref:PrgI family protein n=1 Tax=Catenulispora pinisilvae TaxID=2705253 RepID=UPI002B279E18|nr:PrgI family protein [Catenulispora pinisilvae]
MSDDSAGYSAVRIPTDVSRPDRVLGPATARQVAIVGGTAAVLWCVWLGVRVWVSPLVFLVPAVFVLVVVGVAISTERDGLSIDRLLAAALRQMRSPRRQVMAPEGLMPPPPLLSDALSESPSPRSPAPLSLPITGLDDTGLIDLGTDGTTLMAGASTINFGLRTADEQDLLLGGFARWLNSLSGPTQITSTNAPADVSGFVNTLRDQANSLPHPALGHAAQEHADFLGGLALTRVLLARSIHLALREQGKAAAQRVARRAEDAVSHLAACEIRVTPLGHEAASADLRALLDPSGV